MRTVTLATSNPTKIIQLKDILRDRDVLSMKEAGIEVKLPEETGDTYEENAILKCRAVANKLSEDCIIIADDSGFEVEALDSFPGIISSRWAKQFETKDKAREELNNRLEEAIAKNPKLTRRAKFVCVLAVLKDNKVQTVYGEVKGTVVYPPRGNNHFLYDAMFMPDGQNITAGEMDLATKQKFSSRIVAFNKLRISLRKDSNKSILERLF